MSPKHAKPNKPPADQVAPAGQSPSSAAHPPIDAILDAKPPQFLAGRQQEISISASYSGPVPPPSILRQYDELVPGSAAKILIQAERQTNHRIELENKITSSDIRRSNWGLAAGFTVAMTAIVGGIVLVAMGHDWAGVAIAGVAGTSLVGVFVYGKATQMKERRERAKLMLPVAKGAPPA